MSFAEGLTEKTFLNGSNVDPNFDASLLNITSKKSHVPRGENINTPTGHMLTLKNNNMSTVKSNLSELSQNQTIMKRALSLKTYGFFSTVSEIDSTKNKGNSPISQLQLKSNTRNKPIPLKITKILKGSRSIHPIHSPQK